MTSLAMVAGAVSPAAAEGLPPPATPTVATPTELDRWSAPPPRAAAVPGTVARILRFTPGIARTPPPIRPLPRRPPGLGVLLDVRPRPVAATTFRPSTTNRRTPAITASTRQAVAAVGSAVRQGHPSDRPALSWARHVGIQMERQVDRALAAVLPRNTPLWVRLELRRTTLTAVKSTYCNGLEAVVLAPDGNVSVDVKQVLVDVLAGTATPRMRAELAHPINRAIWERSVRESLSNIAKSSRLRDARGVDHEFHPTAYQGYLGVRYGYHVLASRPAYPVITAAGRSLAYAAFLHFRLCYAPPTR